MVAVVLGLDNAVSAACAGLLASDGADVVRANSAAQAVAVDGPVDVLVTVPRQPVPGRPDDTDPAAYAAEVQQAVDAVLPDMVALGQGRIVIVVTATGLPGQAWADGAGTAMWGLVGLARTAARQVAASGVTVNVVRTGLVDDAEDDSYADDPEVAAAVDAVEALTPMKRTPTADDVAGAVAFLASADASYITGIVLPVDGGLTIGQGA